MKSFVEVGVGDLDADELLILSATRGRVRCGGALRLHFILSDLERLTLGILESYAGTLERYRRIWRTYTHLRLQSNHTHAAKITHETPSFG